MVTVRVYSKFFTSKVGKNSRFIAGVFNKTNDAAGACTSASWLLINCEWGGLVANDIFPDSLPLLFSFCVTSEWNFETFLSVANPLLRAPPK